jgi:HSP20 family molecular chaperone IbpA
MPPRDLQVWMWAEACEALARAERLHRQFFRVGASVEAAVWEPPVDIFETRGELWIVAALPGVDAPHVEIGVEDGVLIIAGERPAPALQRAAGIHRLEIPQGRFERRIALPPGRYDLARRDLADGCLTLALRKLG